MVSVIQEVKGLNKAIPIWKMESLYMLIFLFVECFGY